MKHRKNFWEADLSNADVVYAFALDTAMPKLQDKLSKELKDGTYVVSFLWTLPNWRPVDQTEVWSQNITKKLISQTGILLYQKGESDKPETEEKEPNSKESEIK